MFISNNADGSYERGGTTFTLFCVWSFFLVCRPQDYLPLLEQAHPVLTLGIATLIAYIPHGGQEPDRLKNRQLTLYAALFAVMAASIPFSCYAKASLFDLYRYSTVAAYVFLFSRLVTSVGRLRRILFIYCTGLSLYLLSALVMGTLDDGRISFGSMFDPNDIAFFTVSLLAFNFIFVSGEERASVRAVSLASIAVGILIIMKSGSRSGFIALCATAALLTLARNSAFRVSTAARITILVAAAASLQFVDFNMERLKSISTMREDYNMTSEEGRIAIWETGIRLMLSHPITGVGYNRFPEAVGTDRQARGLDSSKWQTAHNSLLQIGAETGIAGFLIFALLSLNSLRIFGRAARRSRSTDLARIGEIARVGFVGHLISAMFLSQAYSVYWAFYIGFSAVVWCLLERESEPGCPALAGG